MRDRDSNETEVADTYHEKPAPDSLGRLSCPLITQEYGITDELGKLMHWAVQGKHRFNITRKVDTETRYVIEIEAVSPPVPLTMRPPTDHIDLMI